MAVTETEHPEIYERITAIRKYHKYSQKETARLLNISRSSFAQIERGKRNISALELKRLAHIFQFSIDHFFSNDFAVGSEERSISFDTPTDETEENYLRIAEPVFNFEKFKQVYLYLLTCCMGKAHLDKIRLHQLLYIADFNHYEIYETHLSTCSYEKRSNTPYIINIEQLLTELEKEEAIQGVKIRYQDMLLKCYIPLKPVNLQQLKASETALIKQVIQQFGLWPKQKLLNHILSDMPMKATKINETIDYELVFYRGSSHACTTDVIGEL